MNTSDEQKTALREALTVQKNKQLHTKRHIKCHFAVLYRIECHTV